MSLKKHRRYISFIMVILLLFGMAGPQPAKAEITTIFHTLPAQITDNDGNSVTKVRDGESVNIKFENWPTESFMTYALVPEKYDGSGWIPYEDRYLFNADGGGDYGTVLSISDKERNLTLTNASLAQARADIFVEKTQSWITRGIPDGRYRLLLDAGMDYDAGWEDMVLSSNAITIDSSFEFVPTPTDDPTPTPIVIYLPNDDSDAPSNSNDPPRTIEDSSDNSGGSVEPKPTDKPSAGSSELIAIPPKATLAPTVKTDKNTYPVLEISVPALNMSGNATVRLSLSGGSFSEQYLDITKNAQVYTLHSFNPDKTVITKVELLMEDKLLAKWQGTVTLSKTNKTTISLTEQMASRIVDTMVTLDGDAYTGGDLEITYYNAENNNRIGPAPQELLPGEQILIKVAPNINAYDLKYFYKFPTDASEYYQVTVPDDGNITINVEGLSQNAVLAGTITDKKDTRPIAGASVTVSQAFENEHGSITTVSRHATTDEDGKYQIVGLYEGKKAELVVSQYYYVNVEDSLAASDVTKKSIINSSMVKKQSFLLLNTSITDSSDEGSYANIAKAQTKGLTLEVYNKTGKPIPGNVIEDLKELGSSTYKFLPDKEADLNGGKEITLTLTGEHIKDASVEVITNENGTAEADVKLIPKGAAIYRSKAEVEAQLIGCAILFREDGTVAAKVKDFITTDTSINKYLFADAGTYTFVLLHDYENLGSSALKLSDITNLLLPDEFIMIENVTIKDNLGTYLSEDEVFKVPEITDLSQWLTVPQSYISAPEAHNGYSLLKVAGHIELRNKKNATLSNIKIAIYDPNFPELPTGEIPANGIVINGNIYNSADDHLSSTTMDQVIKLNNEKVPTEFFFYIRPSFEDKDIEVRVTADVTIGKDTYKDQIIGNKIIKKPYTTISANDKTSSEHMEFHGTAPAGGKVTVYDGSVVIGSTTANDNGNWSIYATLFGTSPDAKTPHLISAKCNNQSSNSILVIHNSKAAALLNISIGNDFPGIEKSNLWAARSYYSWLPGWSYYFTATFENGKFLEDKVTFYITCSNGIVIELAGKRVDDNNMRTEAYPFGSSSLVPTKVWVSYDSKISEEVPIWASDTDNKGVNYTTALPIIMEARKIDYKAMNDQVRKNVKNAGYSFVTEGASNLEPKAGQFVIKYKNVKLTPSQIKSSVDSSFRHTSVYTESGTVLYDSYIKYEQTDTGYNYTIYAIDYTKSKDGSGNGFSYTYRQGSKDSTFTNLSFKMLSNTNKNSDDEVVDGAIQGVVDTSKQYGVYGSNLPGANVAQNITTIDNVKSTLQYDSDICQMENTYNYMESQLGRLRAAGVDTTRLENYIKNGRNSAAEAKSLAYNALATGFAGDTATGLATYVDPTGATPYLVNLITGTGGMEMDTNVNIVYNGAYGDYLESRLLFQKLTGVDQQTFDQGYNSWIFHGEEGYQIPINGRGDSGFETENNVMAEFYAHIDPSGYIYEAVSSNHLPNATVSLYQEIDGSPVIWDGISQGNQQNPVLSLIDGRYAWEVPEGNWFVHAFLDGYQENTSNADPAATIAIGDKNWLPVLPPQLNVNIGLTSYTTPTILSNEMKDGKLVVTFSKYMYPDTVTGAIQVLLDGNVLVFGEDYKILATNEEISPDHTPLCGGKALASIYTIEFKIPVNETQRLNLQVNDTAESYANVTMAFYESDDIKTEKVVAEASADATHAEDGRTYYVIIIILIVIILTATAGFLLWHKKNVSSKDKKIL